MEEKKLQDKIETLINKHYVADSDIIAKYIIELPEIKAISNGHLIIYQDIKVMPNGFGGLIAPYWRISLTDGLIEMSCDKNNWASTELKLKIELE